MTGRTLNVLGAIAVASLASGCLETVEARFSDEIDGTYLENYEQPEDLFDATSAEARARGLANARSYGFGLVHSPDLNGYVNGILQSIIAVSPVPEIEAAAFVTASNDFDAHARADGSIFVSVGLLRTLETEDELAFVLAHELAHILLRHHKSDIFEDSQKKFTQLSSLADGLGQAVTGEAETETGATNYLVASSYMSTNLLAPNLFGKLEEEEADRLGVDLMIAARYDHNTAVELTRTLAAGQLAARQRNQEELEARTEAAGTSLVAGLNTGTFRESLAEFGQAIGGLLRDGGEHLVSVFGSDYKDERADRMRDYLAANYRYTAPPQQQPFPWRQDRPHAGQAIFLHYQHAADAEVALADDQLDEAMRLARAALSPPTQWDAYPRIVLAKVRTAQKQETKAIENLDLAKRSKEPAFAVYQALIERHLTRRELDFAAAELEEAAERLGDPPYLLPLRIDLLSLADKNAEAAALAVECKVQYPDLASQCDPPSS